MTQVQRAHRTSPVRSPKDAGRDDAHRAAGRNIRNQERLFRDIVFAQVFSGEHEQIVASRLGISEQDLRDAVSGKTDLTMTELRLLASACEVVVDYRVVPAWVERRRHGEAAQSWLRSDRALRAPQAQDERPEWEISGLSDFFLKRANAAS
jgi:hypothetical protein